MPEKITKVIYDVKEAIANLAKLNQKVDESGKKTENALGGVGTRASELFNKAIGKLPGTIGRAATGLTRLAGTMGPIAFLAGGAAAAVGSLVAQFIDFPALLRDSAEGMDTFRAATQRVLDTQNALSDIEDAASLANFKRITRSIRVRQAEADFQQVATREAIDNVKRELSAAKEALREREQAVKDSVKRREQLEDRLAKRRAGRIPGLTTPDPDIRASETLDKAVEAAKRGQLDAAERLVEAAKDLQPELENQAFFIGKLQQTEKDIDSAIQSQIDKIKQAEAAEKSRAAQAQSTIDAYTQQADALDRQNKALTNLKTKLSGELRLSREESRRDVASRGRDEAVRGINKVARDLRREMIDGGRSVAENIKDSFLQSINNLKKSGLSAGGQEQVARGLQALVNFDQVLNDLAEGTATFGDIKRFLDQNALAVSEAVGALEVVTGREGARGFQTDIDQLNRINESIQSMARFLQQAVANDAAFQQAVVQGTESQFDRLNRTTEGGDAADKKLQDLATSATSAADVLAKIGSAPIGGSSGPVITPPAATATPSAGLTGTGGPITINVNATVQGGIIDREVTEQITDIIRRELRKVTSEGI